MAPTAARKRGRPRNPELLERRREEILDTAARIFARLGYPGTDVQLVADALEVGKGTIYRYFPSKEELFLASVDRGMLRLRAEIDASVVDLTDPLDRVERAIRTYLSFFKDHPEFVELMIQERAEFRDRKKSTYFEHRDKDECGGKNSEWSNLFAGLMVEGRVRDIPVKRILDVSSDLVYGTMFTNHFAGRHKPLEEQAQDILDIVFNGILTTKERRRRGGSV